MNAVVTPAEAFAGPVAAREGEAPAWLAERRAAALARFHAEGWPSTRQEAWRHTSLAPLAQQPYMPADTSAATLARAADVARRLRGNDGDDWLVFVDGRHVPALSTVGELPPGAALHAWAEAADSRDDAWQAHFGKADDGASTAALNLALAGDGAVLRLADGVVLTRPVHWLFIAATPGAASCPRNFILAGQGARATVMEHYVGCGQGQSLTNAVSRVRLGDEARVVHLKLQQEAPEAFHLGAVDVRQGQGSHYHSHSLSFGARLARHDIATRLDGEQAEVLLNGLYYVDGRRHVDHRTLVDHAHPNCRSHEFYRGILDDQARGVFAGRILVGKGADGTDAVQRSDSLLLSRLARTDARPELEIYADDVKCAHGATVGQIDDDSLFYLRSRGLDIELARGVLTYAFAAQALARIEEAPLRAHASTAIRRLLPAGQDLGGFV